MKYMNKIKAAAIFTMLLQADVLSAATFYGTYSVEATASLAGGQGFAYNGTDWFSGSADGWQKFVNSGWQNSSAPTGLDDGLVNTFVAAYPTKGTLNLSVGFNGTSVVNGAGADLAFFALWDQSSNSTNVTINGVTRNLNFQTLYNQNGVQQVANNVIWNGSTRSNVLVVAGAIDLSDFGLLAGAALTEPFNIGMLANASGTSPVALSMVGALHTGQGTTAVPVPAPFVLLFSGLAALGLVGRRKR